MSAAAPPAPSLLDDVRYLRGVGPRRAELLAGLGIRTAGDLLEYFPARHERQEFRTVEDLEPGITATVIGQVGRVQARRGRRGATVNTTLTDNTGRCSLCWFNAGWLADRLEEGTILRATGRVMEHRGGPQMVNPRIRVLGEDAEPVDESSPAKFEPVYPASAVLSSRELARLISSNLDRLLAAVEECHPREHLRERRLAGRSWALGAIHRPTSEQDVSVARRRLAYDELLLMQLAVALARRRRRVGAPAEPLASSSEIDRRIRRRFPFVLTAAQDRAVAEIIADLAKSRPMNRLLQGDVGCGKTVVALYAALVAVANRTQAAIMAPTELLAEQHRRSIARYLAGSRVRSCLLTGGSAAAERRRRLGQIDRGEIDLVVGTHALLQKDVRFARLGLVVVDEQHRFGVRQRATIRSKGPAPHYLVMTATPIPRTLAMTVFGDLDVTTIDGRPPGRGPVLTRVVGPGRQEEAWAMLRQRLAGDEQAFVVYPLIDESDKVEARAATTEFRRLADRLAPRRVGLLHGRMTAAEREAVMREFAAGRIGVLAATTVVEVGIDVPGATCMVIEHAERYGLSQLHQLRGRVGRGGRPGYCWLLTDSPAAEENQRLAVLARTQDGFRIAEEDLRLRGPGEMLGTRQHGMPELRVADLLADADLLRMAQRDAADIVRADPSLRRPEHAALRRVLAAKYRDTLSLLDVA